MTPPRTTLALLLLAAAFILAAGCVSGPEKNGTKTIMTSPIMTPSTHVQISVTPMNISSLPRPSAPGSIDDPIVLSRIYKENLMSWKGKLTTELLYITDPDYYPRWADSPEEVRREMHDDRDHRLLYPDEAIARFGIRNTSDKPVGDYVHVWIQMNGTASLNKVESYLTEIDGVIDSKGNLDGKLDPDADINLYGWVDLNNLEKIASQKDVKMVDDVFGPYFV